MVRVRAVRVSRETSLAIISEGDQQRTMTLKKVLLCTSPHILSEKKRKKNLINFYSEAWVL
jgi:hypothetical protein